MLAHLRCVEPEVLGLEAVLNPGDQVFDVGAAYGMYTFPLAHLVGESGSVHSFEPQSKQQRILTVLRRVIGANRINLNQCVLGAEQGEHNLLLPIRFGIPFHGHAHVAQDGAPALTPWHTNHKRQTIIMATIDSWCAVNNIENVAFIKMDAEGFEPNVIEGAAETIDRSRPGLLLEIENRHVGRYGWEANQFADAIRDRWPEYGMYTWSRGSWRPADRVRQGTRNYLFATETTLNRCGKSPD